MKQGKKLLIYYSLSGNLDWTASWFQRQGYDICKVEMEKPMPRAFFLQILRGGYEAMREIREPLITPLPEDLDQYDEIVAASPIWNGRIAPPILSILDALQQAGCPFTMVLSSGSGKADPVQKQLQSLPVQEVLHLRQPLDNQPEALQKLERFFRKP